METAVRGLFARYESLFNRALGGEADTSELASLYASEAIGAAPAGVRASANDDRLRQALAQSCEHYRAIGTRAMRTRTVRIAPIDELHCIAHVSWTATYERTARPELALDFDVHYLVQMLNGDPKVFGWISGDEQALLKAHGVI